MKNLRVLVVFVLIMHTMVSCRESHREDKEIAGRLEALWNLSECHPDSAAIACMDLGDSVKHCSEYTRELYNLLCIRIREKRNMTATAVDSVKSIAEYMERHGVGKTRIRAYYYLASQYDDLNDGPLALAYGLKTLSFASKPEECDSDILMKAYSLLSSVYRKQDNAVEAVDMALLGLNLAKSMHKEDCLSYMDVATSFKQAGDRKMALKYSMGAYRLLLRDGMGGQSQNISVASELMYIFAQNKMYGKSDTLMSLLTAIPNFHPNHQFYFAKGIVCKERGDTLASIDAFRSALASTTSVYARQAALSNLFALYYYQGKYREASQCALQYQNYNRTVRSEEQREWTRNANGRYKYQSEKETVRMIVKRKNQAIWGCIAAATMVFVVVAGFLYCQRKKYRRMLESRDEEMKRISDELCKKDEEICTLETNYASAKENLKNKIEQVEYLSKRLLHLTSSREYKELVTLLENVSNGKLELTERQWNDVYAVVENLYPGFENAINASYPKMNDETKHTCYLIKMGLKDTQIRNITESSRQTYGYRKAHLQEVLGSLLEPKTEFSQESIA